MVVLTQSEKERWLPTIRAKKREERTPGPGGGRERGGGKIHSLGGKGQPVPLIIEGGDPVQGLRGKSFFLRVLPPRGVKA